MAAGWMLGVRHWGACLVWGTLAALVSGVAPLWRQHYRFFGFRDALRLFLAAGVLCGFSLGMAHVAAFMGAEATLIEAQTGALAGAGDGPTWVIVALLTFMLWGGLRAAFRAHYEPKRIRHRGGKGKRTLIVGAGRAGVMVADELLRHGELDSQLVGFVDDSLSKQGLCIQGVPVLGPCEMLSVLVVERGIQRIILAIPSATGSEMRRIASLAQGLGVEIKTVPGIYNLLGPQSWQPTLQDVSIEDLLRRDPVRLNQERLASVITGQVVLVTGGGGSIGSELARQLCRFQPRCLVLLGRGENSLWQIERELKEAFPEQKLALELCDIRNRRRLEAAFSAWKPAIVFHAAAHKHVPFLEAHPEEGIENNVFGTRNVLDACLANRVSHFVNISTDKAVNPTNVLGVTKRLAERVVASGSLEAPSGSRYVSVRFGNVLGSRGSVVNIFRDQIQRGGPITITDPEMTRYFMTIPEASQLVLQAGLLGETGKVYVLDMGASVKIVDLAKDMIRLSGLEPEKDVEIAFTGARPGEKLFEELFHDYAQSASSRVHEKVFEAKVALDDVFSAERALLELEMALEGKHALTLVELFKQLVPTYQPAANGLAGQSTRGEVSASDEEKSLAEPAAMLG